MVNRVALIALILFSAAGALAILPPDASMRVPELRANAIKVRKEYEERIEKRRELATGQYEQATADIGVPPWELKRRMSGKPSKQVQAAIEQVQTDKKEKGKQFLVSILLLIIIGSIVGWIRYKTHEGES
jgi:hypothetical protein